VNRCKYCSKTFTHAPAHVQHERGHVFAAVRYELHQRNDTLAGARDKQTGEDKDGEKGGGVASGGRGKGVEGVYRCKPTEARIYLRPFKTLLSSIKTLLRLCEQVQVLQQDVYTCSCPRSARALTRMCG